MRKQSINFEDDLYAELEKRRGALISQGAGNVSLSELVNILLRKALKQKEKP